MSLPQRPPLNQPIPNADIPNVPRQYSVKAPYWDAVISGDLTVIGSPPSPPDPQSSTPQASETPSSGTMKKRERAREEDGKFIGDDPSTPENEAWVS